MAPKRPEGRRQPSERFAGEPTSFAELLREAGDAGVTPTKVESDEPAKHTAGTAGRRNPAPSKRRARPGATPEQLVRRPTAVVVVDGYNVSMAGWPDALPEQQRDFCVRHAEELAQRWRLKGVVVVFDGDDIGGRSSRAARTVRVEFSASHEEADDAIVRMVRRDASSRPYVVVTSDRDLGDRCRRLGADVLDSAAFRQL